MEKDTINTILLAGVLVVLLVIAIILAVNLGDENEDEGIATHTHDEYVEKTGDIMTGDLLLENLYANGVINGDGSRIWNLNASMINTGTIGTARLPANIDAGTLDGYDSTAFPMIAHNHDERYYTETESDAKFALIGHTHPPGDADTLDGLDSTVFAMATHTHDDRYYNKTQSDARFALIGHTHPPGDADTLDGLDSTVFAMAVHTHAASDITSGFLDEARLPQYAIDNTEIEVGFGLVPSGTIVMWNGTTIPNGWVLCDGTNGTPDLRGMFIVGYDPTDSDYNVTGNTGGEKTHTLTINEMPQHQHHFSGTTSMDGDHQHSYEDRYWDLGGGGLTVDENDPMSVDDNSYAYQNKLTNPAGAHSHTFSGDTDPVGGGQAHENRPPYYVLAFIMKL